MIATTAVIAVVGATGHTGRFVVDEIERRQLSAIRIGRDLDRLTATNLKGHEVRVVELGDPSSLDRALRGAAAVINCAGPFIDTASPVIDAALRAQIAYLDITAEQAVAQSIFHSRHDPSRQAGITVLPAAAFFGGLADLLAVAAIEESDHIEEVAVAVGLDSWQPTQGTRITGQRNTAPRLVKRDGTFRPIGAPPPAGRWDFPQPLGSRSVMMLSFSEMATLGRHLRADTIESWINVEPIRDIRDPETPPPQPSDRTGRSSQQFVMDVMVLTGERRRRATAIGRDIYYVSAPIIVEAAQRLLAGEGGEMTGVRTLSELFDARDFLRALGPDVMTVSYSDVSHSPLETEAPRVPAK